MSSTSVTVEIASGNFKTGRVHPSTNKAERIQAEDSRKKLEEPAHIKFSPYRLATGKI